MATINGTPNDDRFEDELIGTAEDDEIFGFEGRDDLTGLAGDDTLDGGAGDRDAARYYDSPQGITGSLTTNTVSDGFGGTDTLINIEEIRGSNFNDTLTAGDSGTTTIRGRAGDDILIGNNTTDADGTGFNGGPGNDTITAAGGEWTFIEPGSGDDVITGGTSFDSISYFFDSVYDNPPANTGVTVTFTGEGAGTAIDYRGDTDTFTGIERIEGTMFADVLTGAGGYQSFRPTGGDDTIDGGADADEINYDGERDDAAPEGAVVVDLAAGTATDKFGDTDTLISIEFVRGSRFDDQIIGDDQFNRLRGMDGDDTLRGGEGIDTLDGGEGTDTALYEGDQSNYTLTISSGSASIDDRRANVESQDELTSVEFLDFDTEHPLFGDNPMNLDAFDDAVDLNAEDFASITELYIAYFNRAPDAIGLNFWASAFARGEVTLETMAEQFFDQAETRSTYADVLNETGTEITDVAAFVTEVYGNVLGREFDQAGRDFWVGVLESGDVTPGSFIGEIIAGAKAAPPADADQAFIDQQMADQQYLANKIDIGIYFSVINGMSDTEDATAVMDLFTGTQDSIDAAVAQTDTLMAAAQAADGGDFLMQLVGVIDDPFAG